jgi:hypothetical protein
MGVLLVMFPMAQQSLLFEANSILSQVRKNIGQSILQGFGLGALGAVQQHNNQFARGLSNGNQVSFIAGLTGALHSLTAFHMAGQYLQREINPASNAGSLLQSRLDDISNARLLAVSNLQQLTRR